MSRRSVWTACPAASDEPPDAISIKDLDAVPPAKLLPIMWNTLEMLEVGHTDYLTFASLLGTTM